MGEDCPQHCEKENLNQLDNTDMGENDNFKIPELSKLVLNLQHGYKILTISSFISPMSLEKLSKNQRTCYVCLI